MNRRLVAVLASGPALAGGFPDERLRVAMAEDGYETVAALELVEPVLAVRSADPAADALAEITWPGTAILTVAASAPAVDTLTQLSKLGADEATLLTGDAPDLPGLLVGKLHRALGSSEVAVLPADGGGLVGFACRCPPPPWTIDDGLDLDAATMLDDLRRRAPRRNAVSVGPGWHRVRVPADLERLDPGLEGWDATRGLISR